MSDADIIPIAAFVKRDGGKYAGQLRAPKGDIEPTCDWGQCHRPSVLERFSPSLGWIAICDICSQIPWKQAVTEGGHRE